MKVINIGVGSGIPVPKDFAGVVKVSNGDRYWVSGRHPKRGNQGRLHREDGPAVETADGDKHWFLDGKQYTEEDHYKRTAWTRTSVGKLMLKRKDYDLEER